MGITAADIRKFNYGCLSVDAYAGTKAATTGSSRETAINFLMLKIKLSHEDMWVSEYMTAFIFILDARWRVRLRVLFNDTINC